MKSTYTPRFARLLGAGFATLLCVLAFSSANAQSRAGNISFGFDIGGNKYYGNFTDSKFGFGGDLYIRWNMLDWLSLHGAWQGGQLRYGVSATALQNYPEYFGTNVVVGTSTYPGSPAGKPITVDPTNVIRTGEWQLMVSANVFPSETFVPYFIVGLEALNWEAKTANNGQGLPNNANEMYSKDVLAGVLGVGYELYVSNKVTFNGKVLMHLTGTDWLDDYAAPNQAPDAFLTAAVGFGYVIFAPPEEKVGTVSTGSTTTYVTNDNRTVNNYTTTYVNKSDTIYVEGETDTVWLRRPAVNTVLNFPGTLFIVNTDEFNMKEPGNASNLRRIKELVEQCPEMRVEIQGFASSEGTAERNQELSELRAKRIKTWLISAGVNGEKVQGTVGYGTSRPMVNEPTGVSAEQLEAVRTQNRRIAVRVTQTCAR